MAKPAWKKLSAYLETGMATFKFSGINAAGEKVSGRVDAGRKVQALTRLRERQIDAYDLQEVEVKARQRRSGKPKSRDYFQILNQLAVLLDAGINVLDAVDSLKLSAEHELIYTELTQVSVALRRGEKLSDAMQAEMPNLPAIVPSLAKLGEQTGTLPDVMRIVTTQLGRQEKVKSDLQSAFTYPIFLFAIGVAAVLFLLLAVVPRFGNLLGDKVNELPGLSAFVFSLSTGLRTHGLVLLIAAAALLAFAVSAAASPRVRSQITGGLFHVPVLGPLMRAGELANWTRTVGVAFRARANLIDAVTLARRAVSSSTNKAAFDEVARDLRSGMTLDQALEKVPQIEPLILNLVRTGIKSGRLADMLLIATETLDERIETTTKRVSRLAEPIAIMLIAGIIGFVVVSLVSAMTSLYDFAL